jgi:hypothetical protein
MVADIMRPVLLRCPNRGKCTIGYRCDDIEFVEGTPAVCPECGKALVPAPKRATQIPALMVNAITVVVVVSALWWAWPRVVLAWEWLTSP